MLFAALPPSALLRTSAAVAAKTPSTRCSRLTMKLAAAHQPAGNVGCLKQGALGREMGSEIPGHGDKDMSTLVAVAPLAKLPHTGF
jgi:hypothetical protein